MNRVRVPQSLVGRCIKIGMSIGIAATVAACSSASSRFGTNDQTQDPGYDPNNNKHVVTGSLSDQTSNNNDFDRDVASQPLNDPTQNTHQTVSAPVGNNAVIVQQGDTLYSISRQNGVNVADLKAVNNLYPPYEIKPGQQLILPARTSATQVVAAPQPSINPAAANIVQTQVPGTHQVMKGQTLYSISRAYGHKPETVAAHNQIHDLTSIKTGQRLRIPARNHVVQANHTQPTRQPTKIKPQASLNPVPQKPDTSLTPVTPSKPTTTARAAPQKNPPVPAMTSSKFRWPVKGRIISSFGNRPSGARNDGINIAVPEGTSVKSAENGVVAYSGNELKGYGNLILIRHANNWVTAYAHNKELFVRRGDTVQRGQIIAKAGKSGSVTTPQLHFEIRKGAQAVDPTKYLSPNNLASN